MPFLFLGFASKLKPSAMRVVVYSPAEQGESIVHKDETGVRRQSFTRILFPRFDLLPPIPERFFGNRRQRPEIMLPGEDKRQVTQVLGFVCHRALSQLGRSQQGMEEFAVA